MACVMVIFVITDETAVLKSSEETIQLNWAKSETVSHVEFSEVLLRTEPTVSRLFSWCYFVEENFTFCRHSIFFCSQLILALGWERMKDIWTLKGL